MSDWLYSGDYAAVPVNIPLTVLGLLLAFLGGHLIAWVYMLTHSGLSYSKSFVNSLVMMCTVVALVMMVMANNLVTAFGLMAVFAIVRFRNILRDTLDTTYVLAVIVVGMACGTQKFATAVVGCVLICSMLLYLWFSGFGRRHRYDVIVNMHWGRPLAELPDLFRLFRRHGRKAMCASQRSSDAFQGVDLSYRILLRDPERMEDLLLELRALQGVSRVSGLRAEEESEL
ncbi:MAG TPA: DUF4956 domain-containing protein [Verrucomicrobiae bacterium]|nr:DUF4956 domain-containing protein [Verrucomicrobiae bacterium]